MWLSEGPRDKDIILADPDVCVEECMGGRGSNSTTEAPVAAGL